MKYIYNWFYIALCLVFIIGSFFLYNTISNYIETSEKVDAYNDQIASASQELEDLYNSIARLDDENYINQQARNRFYLVEEGQSLYVFLDASYETSLTQETVLENDSGKSDAPGSGNGPDSSGTSYGDNWVARLTNSFQNL